MPTALLRVRFLSLSFYWPYCNLSVGIGLHIERSSNTPAYGMVFRRASTSVIHIGRRPGTDPERRSQDIEDGNAMFRCAVVSRKHAKIALSDSGHVRLTLTRRSNSYHRSLSFVLLCTYRHTLSIWARTTELTFASGVKGLPRSSNLRHLHCLLTAMSSLLARQWARARSVCGPSRQGWNFYMAPRLSHPSSL